MVSYTFKKAERLCSKALINNLFVKGNRVVSQFPFRVLWQFTRQSGWEFPAQAMISVSKRNFPKAVDRNRVKRQMRELYRLNKHRIYDVLNQNGQQIILSVSYQGKESSDMEQLRISFEKVLVKLIRHIEDKQQGK